MQRLLKTPKTLCHYVFKNHSSNKFKTKQPLRLRVFASNNRIKQSITKKRRATSCHLCATLCSQLPTPNQYSCIDNFTTCIDNFTPLQRQFHHVQRQFHTLATTISTRVITISSRVMTISHPCNDNFNTCNDNFTPLQRQFQHVQRQFHTLATTISHPCNDNFITCNDKFTKGFSYKVSKTKQLKKIFLQKTTKKEHFLAQIMLKNKKITAIKQK